MPELPEVETTRRGIMPYARGQTIRAVTVREPRLRWPVPRELATQLSGATIRTVQRRAKYLVFRTSAGAMLLHLGMSGSLRIVDADTPIKKHDHLDIALGSGRLIRFHDPRRFGSVHLTDDTDTHPLLASLGPEPLGDAFDGNHLHAQSRGRRVAVKVFIMNARVVVGVGNIYASEALHLAGIHPRRAAGRIGPARYQRLADAIHETLTAAIAVGGTTLRDFYGGDGEPGYFRQCLHVYERDGEPCRRCGGTVRREVLGQRASYYCPGCQF
ncbi:MAG: bifunctional DNA-formamidopyrimidine glycosylase/DNA-(apurinic or apyrimidinic site) lyase [Pseudomonadota bacterium]